jgi:hypothetical protein
MKVICLDDHDLNGRKVRLTPGKIYDSDLHLDHNESWAITNDAGITRWYYNDVLMPLEKWREIRLKELDI